MSNDIQERYRNLGQELAQIADKSGGYTARSVKVANRAHVLYGQTVELSVFPVPGRQRRYEVTVRPARTVRDPIVGLHHVYGPMQGYSLASTPVELGHDFEEFYEDFIREHE